jgi:hypothetical protein
MGFLSPTAFEERRSHFTGACLTPFVALSGFLALSAPCSPPDRPALFHAGDAPGVSPSELFPLEEPYRLPAAAALMTFTAHRPCCKPRSLRAKRGKPRCSPPASSWRLEQPIVHAFDSPVPARCRALAVRTADPKVHGPLRRAIEPPPPCRGSTVERLEHLTDSADPRAGPPGAEAPRGGRVVRTPPVPLPR